MSLDKAEGINDSWQLLREKSGNQYRTTVTMNLQDGQRIRVRKSTRPEPRQQEIYNFLHLPHLPGKVEKTIA